MENISFENLPKAVAVLTKEVSELKQLLIDKNNKKDINSDRWFDILELLEYLPDKPCRSTVYGWVRERKIPVHKGGKKLRFLKAEIDEWLMEGKKKTAKEITKEASTYLNKKGDKR